MFFLAALAVVLVGFSMSIYYLANSHLMNQLDAVTKAAFDTLTAAIESGPQGLEWEPSNRILAIDQPDGGSLEWAVFDKTGQQVGGSQDTLTALLRQRHNFDDTAAEIVETKWNGEWWRVTRRDVRADTFANRPFSTNTVS